MRRIWIVVLVLGLFTAFRAVEARALSIGFEPVSQEVQVGDPFSVDVVVSDFGDRGVGAWDLNFTFDPAILSWSGLLFGGTEQGDLLDIVDGSIGEVDLTNLSSGLFNAWQVSLDKPSALLAAQSGYIRSGFILARLDFNALSLGTSALGLSVNAIGDAYGEFFGAVQLNGGSATVAAPVPEPSTLLLLASGLAGLAGFRRKLVASPQ